MRDSLPASDVIPIEARFDNENAIGFFHDRVVKGDAREFGEAIF